MILKTRVEPGAVAREFGITECPNREAITRRDTALGALGVGGCTTCNGCRITFNPQTQVADAHCSATVRTERYIFEGAAAGQVVPGLELVFPVEVPGHLQQGDAKIIELPQSEPNKKAA